jgi:tRNA-dihydrouridine synthase
MAIEAKGRIGFLEMRKHLCWYTKGMTTAAHMRKQLCDAVAYEEVEEILCEEILCTAK